MLNEYWEYLSKYELRYYNYKRIILKGENCLIF